MKQFFVYILLCADNSYYTGITNDIERRLTEHEGGSHFDSYTAKRLPIKLVYEKSFKTALEAITFEKQVKSWSRKKKEALIEGHIDKLKELSVCKNETNYLNYKKNM